VAAEKILCTLSLSNPGFEQDQVRDNGRAGEIRCRVGSKYLYNNFLSYTLISLNTLGIQRKTRWRQCILSSITAYALYLIRDLLIVIQPALVLPVTSNKMLFTFHFLKSINYNTTNLSLLTTTLTKTTTLDESSTRYSDFMSSWQKAFSFVPITMVSVSYPIKTVRRLRTKSKVHLFIVSLYS
jgi:hypothetical protein